MMKKAPLWLETWKDTPLGQVGVILLENDDIAGALGTAQRHLAELHSFAGDCPNGLDIDAKVADTYSDLLRAVGEATSVEEPTWRRVRGILQPRIDQLRKVCEQ